MVSHGRVILVFFHTKKFPFNFSWFVKIKWKAFAGGIFEERKIHRRRCLGRKSLKWTAFAHRDWKYGRYIEYPRAQNVFKTRYWHFLLCKKYNGAEYWIKFKIYAKNHHNTKIILSRIRRILVDIDFILLTFWYELYTSIKNTNTFFFKNIKKAIYKLNFFQINSTVKPLQLN